MLLSGEKACLKAATRSTVLQCRIFSQQCRQTRAFSLLVNWNGLARDTFTPQTQCKAPSRPPRPIIHVQTRHKTVRSAIPIDYPGARVPRPRKRKTAVQSSPEADATSSQASARESYGVQDEAERQRHLDILEQALPFEGSTSAYDSPFFRRGRGESADDDIRNKSLARNSTLTELERETFARLFKYLRETPEPGKKKKKEQVLNANEKDKKESDNSQEAKAQDEESEQQDNITRFPDDEIHDAGTDQSELDGYIHSTTNAETAGTLSDYPAELQGMAAKAQMQMARDRQRTKLQRQGAGTMDEETFKTQQRRWRKIETKLYHARTDGAIWEVIKWEIFRRLKVIHEEASAATKDQQDVDAKKRKTDEFGEPIQTNAEKLAPIPLSGYAPLMLLALKLLTRRTSYTALPASLPFLLRSHSRTAFVLCASTAFYNELIEYHFRLHHSVTGVLALVREMHDSTLVGDGQTLMALDEVTRYRRNALQGDYGEAVKALEEMPGKEGEWKELQEWKDRVRSEMERRAVEGARRAEAERRMRQQGVLDDEDEEEEELIAAAA